jgi:hypothetical protein
MKKNYQAFSETRYIVSYTNSSRQHKESQFAERSAADSYFDEKVEAGYKPKLYEELTTVTSTLVRK